MKIRQITESFFEAWSEMVVSHRWWVLLITLTITFATVPQIRHGWLDVSVESFLPHNDPVIIDYDAFRQEFNYTPSAALAIEMKDGIFNLDNLQRLKTLHETIEAEVPYLNEMTSLVNVRYSRGEGDALLVDDLIDVWPSSEEEMPAFRQLILSNPNYVGGLVSANGKVALISIDPHVYTSHGSDAAEDISAGFEDEVGVSESESLEYLQPDEEVAFAQKVLEIKDRLSTEDFVIYSAGGPGMNYQLGKDMETSTINSTGLGLIVIIILLTVLFRRASGVLMPLMVVFMSMLMTLALWPTLGYAFNGNTQIIPTFILAVGIADAVHILSIFYKHYDGGKSKHDAIVLAMKQTSIAVLMTTITTAASLLSFLASDMLPTRTMGIFGAIGVVMALFYTLALMPSLLAIIPIKRREQQGAEKNNVVLAAIDTFIQTCGFIGVKYANKIVVATCLLSLFAVVGLLQVKFKHDPVRWYPEGAELRQAVDLVDDEMDGSMGLRILLETHQENALHEPEILKAVEAVEQLSKSYFYKDTQPKEAISILSVIKETHQSLNENDPNFFVIPDNKAIISQELLLFENSGSEDISDFTNSTFSTARIDLQLRWSNVLHYREYVKQLKSKIEAELEQRDLGYIDVKVTGLLAMFGKTVYAMLRGTVDSYMIAFALVAMLMIILMENVRRGLLAFSPNITPILITVGLMGWFGIPLNMFTSMLGCVVIGISVDDTIHFMHHFQRYAKETDDISVVVKKTLRTCGRAITFTSIVLIGGFIVHVTGMFSVNKQFGLLLSFAIFIALFANLILAPALMTLFWHQKKPAIS